MDAWFSLPLALLFALLIPVIVSSQLNIEIFLFLNKTLNSFADSLVVWENITILSKGIILISLFFVANYHRDKGFFSIFILLIIAALSVEITKIFFDVSRPNKILPDDSFFFSGSRLSDWSFPSGHATLAFCFGAYMYFLAKNIFLKFGFLLFAITSALSRIAVGAHWPEDILVGAILGWVIGYLGLLIFLGFPFVFPWFIRCCIIFCNLLLGCYIIFYDSGYPNTFLLQFSFSVIVILASLVKLSFLFKERKKGLMG